jgi:hypothetical protein
MGALLIVTLWMRCPSLSNQPLSAPSMQSARIFLSCGKRSLLLLDMKTDGKHYYSVLERIGEMPPDK